MKEPKKKETKKSEQSKKTKRSSEKAPKQDGSKWQDFLRRHNKTEEKKP